MAKRSSKESAAGRGAVPELLEGELVTGTDALLADDDYRVATEAAGALRGLIGQLAAFFTTALALEKQALGTLAEAKALKAPRNADEDERVQRFIQGTSRQKREVEEHWKITTVISGFHRRMTARRGKATDALEAANKLGNDLHNAYVAAERRRVQEEERLREERAREEARQQRELELAQLEQEAVDREAASKELSGREQVFVEVYVRTADGVRAAREAGFRDPVKAAERLLKSDKIRGAVQAAKEANALRRQRDAVASRPLDTAAIRVGQERPEMNVRKATGTQNRVYHYGDLVEQGEEVLIAAILTGQHGIPTDLLQINRSKLNDYAAQLQDRINRWPGVRYRREEKVI